MGGTSRYLCHTTSARSNSQVPSAFKGRGPCKGVTYSGSPYVMSSIPPYINKFLREAAFTLDSTSTSCPTEMQWLVTGNRTSPVSVP